MLCYVALYVTARYVLRKTAGQTQEIAYPLLVGFIFFFFLFVSVLIWSDPESTLDSKIGYDLLIASATLACIIPVLPSKTHDALSSIMTSTLLTSFLIIAFDERLEHAAYGAAFGALVGVGVGAGSILYYGTWRRFKAQGFARARTPEERLTETRLMGEHEGKRPSFLYFTPAVIYGLIALQLFLGIMMLVDVHFSISATTTWIVSLLLTFHLFSSIADWKLRRPK